MIDERKLIENITDIEVAWYLDGNYTTYDSTTIMDIIEEQPKVGEWITCSDGLPETGTEVLVTLGYTYESDYTMYSIARYIHFDDGGNHWCDNRYGYLEWDKYSDGRGGNSSYRVIAWMPLPKLYKE